MNTRKWATIAVLLTLVLVTGCATSGRNHMPAASYPNSLAFEPLDRSQYEVLGKVTGFGEASYTGLWPIPIMWLNKDDHFGTTSGGWSVGVGFGVTDWAKASAVYDALENLPDADLLLEPRFHISEKRAGIWYHRAQVTVTGKAVRIKTDEELPEAQSVHLELDTHTIGK